MRSYLAHFGAVLASRLDEQDPVRNFEPPSRASYAEPVRARAAAVKTCTQAKHTFLLRTQQLRRTSCEASLCTQLCIRLID